ncbi:ribosome maturation factor RimP [Saccharobesus litoralis]|uniref:Ribosome maturation factor RimP n=1 Tax=Saccharobesus litoralis TaxID=2172099 RepID=A0A2S0VS85_9ALTE|nr:ribosome maturation factor RimP [Saccharobesus litoralis]AWB67081.1 ribosome maturation factor RimP [Saccharobesus litoralis]
MAKLDSSLEEMIAPAVAATGFELWGIEFVRAGQHSTLRVYVDGENGVTVDDCAEVSRQLSAILDVEDPISSNYLLEVSSPGMDRVLFKLEQYPQYQGHKMTVKTRLPVDGRRKFTGIFLGLEGDCVVVEVDQHEYSIPYKNIDKAQIIPQF